MKRSNFLRREKGLVRSSFLKPSRPKSTPIRKSARGEECTLQFPVEGPHNPDTVVLCHSNSVADGKGMGLKAPDTCAAYGCYICHAILDGRAPRPDGFTHEMMIERFYKAVEATHARLRAKGLLKES